ncbi:hypothetical protein [Luteimonas pelagia]
MSIARDLLFLHGYFVSPGAVQPSAPPVPARRSPAIAEPALPEPPAAAGTVPQAVAQACRVPALQWRLSPPRLFDGLPGWAEPAPDRPRADFGPRYGNRVASLDWFGGVRDACATPAACG